MSQPQSIGALGLRDGGLWLYKTTPEGRITGAWLDDAPVVYARSWAFQLAEAHQLAQLWVHGSLALQLDAAPPEWTVRERDASGWWAGTHRGVWGVRTVYYPPMMDLCPEWNDARTAFELLAALVVLNGALGVPWQWSAGATGVATMRAHSPRIAAPIELPDVAKDAQRDELDFDWCRQVRADEWQGQPGAWIVGVDKNAAYLGTTAGIDAGSGTPIHLLPADVTDERRKLPGYWHLHRTKAATGPDVLAPRSPMPFTGDVWVPTPTLALALAAGHTTITEACVWPEHGRVLGTWQRHMAGARTSLMEMAHRPNVGIALAVFKRIYSQGIAWLNQYAQPPRPDVRHAIIAATRAMTYRQYERTRDAGVAPFGLFIDALYVFTRTPGAPLPGVRMGRELGEYKSIGCIPAASVADALAALASPDGRERLQAFAQVRAALLRAKVVAHAS